MDTRVKLLRNAALIPLVGMVTVTAPGVAAGLAWDESRCGVRGPHRHSGKLGCKVDREQAERWNREARENWRAMHRRASQAARRYAKRIGCDSGVMVARMREFQMRGVLHMHVILPMSTVGERLVSRFYAEQLRDLAEAYGFGHVHLGDRGSGGKTLTAMSAEKAARYLASYIAPIDGQGGKMSLTHTVMHPDVPGHLLYVSRRLTTESGCTIRSLRRWRRAHMLAQDCEQQGQAGIVRLALQQNGCPVFTRLADYFDWWLRQPPADP
jgi:hypothetical protein